MNLLYLRHYGGLQIVCLQGPTCSQEDKKQMSTDCRSHGDKLCVEA